MPREPDQAIAAMNGTNLAWAITHVPGLIPDNLVRSVLAFAHATGHASKPVDRVARYVEAGVASFFRPTGVAA